VGHELGGQSTEVVRALVDDVVAVNVLQAGEFNRFVSRSGFPRDRLGALSFLSA
jgi:hypothetical protein